MASVSISFQTLEPGSSPLSSNKSPFYGKDRIDISGFSRRVSTKDSDNSAPNQSTVKCSGDSSGVLGGPAVATSHHNQPPHGQQQQQHHGVSRKRSHSVHATAVVDWRGAKRRRKAAGGGGATFGPVRPTKFLLGGNISDPLNLGSLNDEEANRLANALTPVCSPIPTPKHRRERLEVIIPQDVSDPLGLNEPSTPTPCQRRCRRSGSTPSVGGVDGPDGATVDAKSTAEGGGEVSMMTSLTASGGKKRKYKKRRKCASGPAASSTCEDALSETTNPPAVEVISNMTRPGVHNSLARSRSEGSGVVAPCSSSSETLPSSQPMPDAGTAGATTTSSTSAVAASQDRTCPETMQGSDEASEEGGQESRRTSSAEIEPSLVSIIVGRAAGASVEHDGTSSSLPSVAVSAASSSTLAAAAITASPLSVVNQQSTTTTSASTALVVVTSPPLKRRRVSYSAMPSDSAAVVSPAPLQCAEAAAAASSSASASACGRRTCQSGCVSSASASRASLCNAVQPTVAPTPRKNVFQYGNYNRYYGYRNGTESDPRLRLLKRQWLVGKDVLDLGCNVGDVTLTVARDYQPRRCVGLDIDSSLVKMARRSVRRYQRSDEFPASMVSLYGQLAPHCQLSGSRFPGNVSFVHANFVLESDAQLDTVRPEFDFIFCLSVSKWIHLNFGDAGLRRFFRRAFLALRPGGRLLLEPQPWPSYMKKKKITPRIWENFQTIRLRPDAFPDLLLNEIGFQDYEPLGRPHHNNKGFNRQLQLYVKAEEGVSSPAAHRVASPNDLATQPGAEEVPPEVTPSDLPPGGEIPNQRPQAESTKNATTGENSQSSDEAQDM